MKTFSCHLSTVHEGFAKEFIYLLDLALPNSVFLYTSKKCQHIWGVAFLTWWEVCVKENCFERNTWWRWAFRCSSV